MSRYSLLVTLHVASVIVWLGASTTLVFVTIYARRARDGVVLGQLGALTWWMSLWVLAPSSVAAAVLGLAAAEVGDWPKLFFFHVGEGAFAFSFLLTLAVRLPLLRRERRGAVDAVRVSRYLLALAVAELTVLYLAVAAMVVKPADAGSGVVRYGAVVLALGLLASAAVAHGARRSAPSGAAHATGGLQAARRLIRDAEAEAHHLYAIEEEGEAAETPAIAIAGLILLVLFPAYVVMLGLAFAAYYLA